MYTNPNPNKFALEKRETKPSVRLGQKIQWFAIFAVLAIYIAQVVHVQAFPDPRAIKQLIKQYTPKEWLPNDRGTICDRNGEPLAVSIPSYVVFLDAGTTILDPNRLKTLSGHLTKEQIETLTKHLPKNQIPLSTYNTQKQAQDFAKTLGKGFLVKPDNHGLTHTVYFDPSRYILTKNRLLAISSYLTQEQIQNLEKTLPARYVPLDSFTDEEKAKEFQKLLHSSKIDLTQIDENEAAELSKILGDGFYIREERVRTYPKGQMLAHVIGYCQYGDWRGLAGIEKLWDDALYFPQREKIRYKGASHLPFQVEEEKLRRTMKTSKVTLTIDSTVQYTLERFLFQAAKDNKAPWAAAVVLDVQTGQVLGMASYPSFNPGDRSTFNNPMALKNNAVNRVYEPGSTFKPIFVGMALERDLLQTKDKFRCPRSITISGATMSDAHPRDNGTLDVSGIIEKSSNVGMAQIGIKFNATQLHEEMKFWNIGQKTGITLNGEEAGLLPPSSTLYAINLANMAIGQGFAVTPLQLAALFNTIPNSGILMRPYIVKEVIGTSGEKVFSTSPQATATVLSTTNADWLSGALSRVVEKGTGTGARSSVVKIAAKTGTAQIAEKGKYVKGKYNASMAGFWPANNPKYTMLVVLGDITGNRYYGGQIVAPVFKDIVEEIERLTVKMP